MHNFEYDLFLKEPSTRGPECPANCQVGSQNSQLHTYFDRVWQLPTGLSVCGTLRISIESKAEHRSNHARTTESWPLTETRIRGWQADQPLEGSWWHLHDILRSTGRLAFFGILLRWRWHWRHCASWVSGDGRLENWRDHSPNPRLSHSETEFSKGDDSLG